MGHQITPFLFEGEHMVRVIEERDGPWFMAKDVAGALSITWSGDKILSRIRGDWKRVVKFTTTSGDKDTIFINEPAVYKLAFRSNKPEAERFSDWVAGEVLPTIRKTGSYTVAGEVISPEVLDARAFPDWPLEEMRTKRGVVDMYRLTYGNQAAQWIVPKLGFPVPPLDLIEHGRQMALALVHTQEAAE